MELKNFNNLKDEIAYLEEAEELLKAIRSIYGHYELWNRLNIYKDEHLAQKLDNHFNFDDNE